MKKIFGFWNLMLLVAGSLFIVSCGDDTDPIGTKGPTVTETHTFDASVDQEASQNISFSVKGVKGDADLKSITVKEDGVNLATSRFKIDNEAPSSAAVLLLGADKQGFTKNFEISLPTESGTYKYEFVLADDNNNTNTVSLEVKVAAVSTITSERMYNYLGPLAGGLDLLTGKAVSKGGDNGTWAGAHIRDNGNNVVPGNPDTYPWKGEFIPWNNSVVRKVNNSEWSNVVGKSQIVTLFNNAGSDLASSKMTVGDVYVVKNETNYFLIKVKSVVNDGSATENNDYSDFEIKQ